MKTSGLFRFVIFAVILSFVTTSFLDEAEAKRRRRRRAKQPKVINEKKLYERMGGKDAIAKTVDEWIRLALADASLASTFQSMASQPKELAKTRKQLSDEICELADGPCVAANDSEWVSIRTRLKMNEVTTVSFASLLSEALMSRGIGERERNEVLGRLGSIEPLAVSEATGPASERRGGNR